MDEEKYMSSFQMIAEAGDAKSDAMRAIKAAREGNFEEAGKLLESAKEKNGRAHDLQFDMVQQEVSGTPVDVNIILVHAQDHMTMALVMCDMAEEMIELYKKLKEKE